MNPYNTADRLMPRDYAPIETVTFNLHREVRGYPIPPNVEAWAKSNLPDGDYVCQYRIVDDAYRFGRVETNGEARRIIELPVMYR